MNDDAHAESTEAAHPDPELVTVFATSEVDLVPVIKSILDGAKIPYVTDGESMMDLFPSDLLGAALHRPKGEMRFQVPTDHVATAKALLTENPHVPADDPARGGVPPRDTPSTVLPGEGER